MSKKLLKTYQKKRNFKKTTEPYGEIPANKSSKLIFVVQEHHARRLHYDFRLEYDGVLKSWAVPKGPSLNPKDKRLAVQTEDHPLEYAKFHGKIPEGEYGAGEVFIWDKGSWEPESEDAGAALQKGELKFKLNGKKLKGSFVLVRTRLGRDQKKNNWLLIKHREEKGVERQDPWPGFIQPQLPRLVTTVPEEEGTWFHEMKYDGYRIQGHLQHGVGTLYTRNGLDWSNYFPHILNTLEKMGAHDAIFDGEIVALDEVGRSHFQKLQNTLKSKNDKGLVYYIFDLLYLDGEDLRSKTLAERKELLKSLLKKDSKNIKYSEHVTEEGHDFFTVSCDHKLEGVVSKLSDSPYRSGRNDLWVKTKCSERQEFVIGGWTGPQGGRTGLGALLLGVYDKDRLRYVGKVGTGFSRKSLSTIKDILKKIERSSTPFHVKSPKGKEIHWVKPEKICEVSFGNWTQEGMLRSPVFQGLRDDKAPIEIHKEKASMLKLRNITSPDKILFTKEKITKLMIADYYENVSKVMLPYVKNRPLSLVRCPQGSEGTCFFQKHISGNVPKSLHTFDVKEEKGEGTYLTINSASGLRELVQLNAFEIHIWNCHYQDYLSPDQIVMDFDPGPGVPWNDVKGAAFELKDILDDLGLKSFVKVTGGKGLHVHIPVAPIYNWEQIKVFAQTLALQMVAQNSRKYVANMAKNKRVKKIFIDYLRNGYGATAVAPYSLRARSTSAVALPITWTELKKVKSSDEFTLEKALKKVKGRKKDPWEGMMKLKQKIDILEETSKKKKVG